MKQIWFSEKIGGQWYWGGRGGTLRCICPEQWKTEEDHMLATQLRVCCELQWFIKCSAMPQLQQTLMLSQHISSTAPQIALASFFRNKRMVVQAVAVRVKLKMSFVIHTVLYDSSHRVTECWGHCEFYSLFIFPSPQLTVGRASPLYNIEVCRSCWWLSRC